MYILLFFYFDYVQKCDLKHYNIAKCESYTCVRTPTER